MLQNDFARLLDEVQVDETLDPEQQADIHAMRGNAQLASRQVDEAAAAYDAALALDAGNPMASLGKAQIRLGERDLEGAKAQLEKYLEVAPDGPDAAAARETVK